MSSEINRNLNFQDAYIKALSKLRDALTPARIQMPDIERATIMHNAATDALVVGMGMPVGPVVVITTKLYVAVDDAT